MAKFGAVFNSDVKKTDNRPRSETSGYITPSSLTIQTSIVKVQQKSI